MVVAFERVLKISSSRAKAIAYIAACDKCTGCSKRWRFSICRKSERIEVEEFGEHNDQPNLVVRIKRDLATRYARNSTAAGALMKMEQDGVPKGHRPDVKQLKNVRPSRDPSQTSRRVADSLRCLRGFVENPLPDVVVDTESVVLTETEVRLIFHWNGALELMEKLQLPCFLCDCTLGTDAQSLRLGAIGPVGLCQGKGQKPSMRFLFVFFLLSKFSPSLKMLWRARC